MTDAVVRRDGPNTVESGQRKVSKSTAAVIKQYNMVECIDDVSGKT